MGWSLFYVALPLAFGVYVWAQHGGERGLEYYTGYLVEKSLSVDNVFVFLLVFTSFAVPVAERHRLLTYGIVGALVLRLVFIVAGAALHERLLDRRARPTRLSLLGDGFFMQRFHALSGLPTSFFRLPARLSGGGRGQGESENGNDRQEAHCALLLPCLRLSLHRCDRHPPGWEDARDRK